MPIIEFGDRDILRGKVITPGWYRVRIDDVGEAPAKDGGSTNYPVQGTVLYNSENNDKEFEGVPLDWNFNSKALGFAIGYLQSFGVTAASGERYELSDTIGKEVDIFIENGEWQGRIVNRVNHKYKAAA